MRVAPWRRRVMWLLFAAAITIYAVQMAKIAAAMTPEPATAVAVVAAAFAALAGIAAVRVASASIQWVSEAPDIALLGALPTPRGALFAAHLASVLAEAARMQLIAIPVVVGCAVASAAAPGRIAMYAVGWVCIVLGVSACGSALGVFVAKWVRPARARLALRLLSMVAAVAIFGVFALAANLGGRRAGRELMHLVSPPGLSWLPTSWLAALLFDGGWLNFLGVAAFAAGATGAACWVFGRWFDIDSALSGAHAIRPHASALGNTRTATPRYPFAALLLKDLRTSSRSATVLVQWLGPIALILVYARVRGGSAGPVLFASVSHIVALVASMTVGQDLARDETDAGWVIRLNSRREGQATVAKVVLVWTVTAATCFAALVVATGGVTLFGCLHVALLSLGHAAFGMGVERAFPGSRKAGKRVAPSIVVVIARQLYTGVAILMSLGATMLAQWLVVFQPLVGLAVLALAEKRAPTEARRW